MEETSTLEDCLVECMIGGNSLASNLIGILGPGFHARFKDAYQAGEELHKTYPPDRAYEIYEQWLCWHALMKAQEAAEKILGRELKSSTNDA
jgi:hypothetical protein